MADDSRPLRADARRNRERVLTAAERVLARDGMAASLREIAREAGVGPATIYRRFPTKEALYEAIVVGRVRRLVEEGARLADADDAGAAFYGFFTLVVEDASDKRMLVDALADAGVDLKAGRPDLRREMVAAIQTLLTRAQRAGAVREDLGMPEILGLLAAASLAAERSGWDDTLRSRILQVMFDGLNPAPRPCSSAHT